MELFLLLHVCIGDAGCCHTGIKLETGLSATYSAVAIEKEEGTVKYGRKRKTNKKVSRTP